jgi:hypothetical protein
VTPTLTYRSINTAATLFGIDRRLSILLMLCAFLALRHIGFIAAVTTFAALWGPAYWVTKHDFQLVVIVPKALQQRKVYDPAKLNN